MSPFLSVRRSLIDPRLSLLSLYTFRPTSFEARQLPLNDELSDAAAGAAVVARSVVAEGLCANAALASIAEAARPTTAYLVNISGSPHFRNALRNPVTSTSVPRVLHGTRASHCGQKPPQ